MNTRLGMLKLAAVALCCAAGVGATQFAHAQSIGIGYNGWHHHSNYNVSIGLGGGYYGGYYGPRYYAPRYYAPRPYYYSYAPAPCYAPYYYNGYACAPYYAPAYYGSGYYGPAISIGYSNYGYGGYGYGGGYRYWNRYGHDGDHDRDDRRPGGWDRHHYHNNDGTQPPHR